MALTDLTGNERRLRVVRTLPHHLHLAAWKAANPPLATEVERWGDDPRRSAKFTLATVLEAVEFCSDLSVLEAVEESEKREKVRSAVYDRRRSLERRAAQSAQEAAPVDTTGIPADASAPTWLALEKLRDAGLERAARMIEVRSYEFEAGTLAIWLRQLDDGEFTELLGHQLQYGVSHAVVMAAFDRGLEDELFNPVHRVQRRLVLQALQRRGAVDAATARKLLAGGLDTSQFSDLRWSEEGIEVLKESRAWTALYRLRRMSMYEIVRAADGLSMDEIAALCSLSPTPDELFVLHDELLRHARMRTAFPYNVMNVLRLDLMPHDDVWLMAVLSSDIREVVRQLLLVDVADRERILDLFMEMRGDAIGQLFRQLGNISDTPAAHALLWELTERIPTPLSHVELGESGWVDKAVLGRITGSLSESDWSLFFSVLPGYPGSIEEFIQTVKALSTTN